MHQDFLPYRDADGLVSPRPTTPGQRNASGNGILYTSEYYIALHLKGLVTTADREEAFRVFGACEMQISPGRFMRTPIHRDECSFDDYVGLAACSHLLGLPFARRLVAYGKAHGWTWHSWFGRQPQFVAHLLWAAGDKPALWRRVWWMLTVLYSAFRPKHDQDARILTWLLVLVAEKHQGWVGRTICKLWRKRLYKDFPGGVGQVLGEYFGNPAHPLSIHLTGEPSHHAE